MVTKDEALTADLFHDENGNRWRRNGKTVTWKRRPEEFRVPVKFGLYGYGYITEYNAYLYHVATAYDKKECDYCQGLAH